MPTVHSQRRVAKGHERRCGRAGCGRIIQVGETYYRFKFRYGGEQYRCVDHYPRSSELTQSKLAQVYAANEDLDDQLDQLTTEDEILDAVTVAADQAREVADEYREADEAFGGYGATENAERADMVEEWANELEGFSSSTDVPGFDPEDVPELPTGTISEADHEAYQEECEEFERNRREWEDALEALRDEVRELLSGCSV